MIVALRSLKNRIKSVENTQKITHAMEMVSSSKLGRVRSRLFFMRSYYSKQESILSGLLSDAENPSHPLLDRREGPGPVALCVITSDAGLCSVYNYAIIRVAEDFINERGRENVILTAVGREGINYFKQKGLQVAASYIELHGRYSDASADRLAGDLITLFSEGDVVEAYVAYTDFSSNLRQRTRVEKYLNIEYAKRPGDGYILEPGFEGIMEKLVDDFLRAKMRAILLSAFTSEHASRMIAMKMATDNAKDLLEALNLLKNKARQAAITKEVLEVAMSAEALKG